MEDKPAAQQIDDIIRQLHDWRGEMLAHLRTIIVHSGPTLIEEVKWKKPSKPAGVPVWSHDGIVCIGEALKHTVRVTFPRGALLKDPKQLFNARLDSSSVRAIDIFEGDAINEPALQALVTEAAQYNTTKEHK